MCQSQLGNGKHVLVIKLPLQAPRIQSVPRIQAELLVTFRQLFGLGLGEMSHSMRVFKKIELVAAVGPTAPLTHCSPDAGQS